MQIIIGSFWVYMFVILMTLKITAAPGLPLEVVFMPLWLPLVISFLCGTLGAVKFVIYDIFLGRKRTIKMK